MRKRVARVRGLRCVRAGSRARRRKKARASACRPRRSKSPAGTSASAPTARACRRARARRPPASVYDAKCLACHGADGAGRPNDQLVGGQGTLREAAPIRTVGSYWPYATTVFDYIRRAMPYVTPHSLTPDETYARHGVSARAEWCDRAGRRDGRDDACRRSSMPNRANFDSAYREPRRDNALPAGAALGRRPIVERARPP